MPTDQYIINNPLSSIKRMTPDERLAVFQQNAQSIYTKFSVYDQNPTPWGFGAKQPYVSLTPASSNSAKHRTKYDSQFFPVGSTVNDVQRVTKFSVSGQGLLFIGKQYLMQNENAFNETRIYNPISLISATAAPASLGAIDRPTRFLVSNGTAGDMVASSLLSFIGVQSKSMDTKPSGTATGAAVSTQASSHGGANKGLVRNPTGTKAKSSFDEVWATDQSGGSKGFLSSLGSALVSRLKSMIPSTLSSSSGGWQLRPEYVDPKNGVYEVFLADKRGLLSTYSKPTSSKSSASKGFLSNLVNGLKAGLFGTSSTSNAALGGTAVKNYHPFTPTNTYFGSGTDSNGMKISNLTEDGLKKIGTNTTTGSMTINRQIDELKKISDSWSSKPINQISLSTERYVDLTDESSTYPSYKELGKDTNSFLKKISNSGVDVKTSGFSTSGKKENGKYTRGSSDAINELSYSKKTSISNVPKEYQSTIANQSKDIIFFHFYDIINERFIPFRATISGLNEVNNGEWDDIQYLGRADKLYLYKGYSRSVQLSFTVYANSLEELVPMWSRINYLVGLTRPSKYTGSSTVGKFMCPPMTAIRIGDMYKDQPAIIRSIGLTIPDDTNWESFRGTGDKYAYLKNIVSNLGINYYPANRSLQLPMKVDISVSMDLLEKERCAIFNETETSTVDHYNISAKDI